MSEMDEPQQTEMVNNETPAGEMPQAQTGTANPELEAIRAALKKANSEAAKYRKEAEAAAARIKAQEDAEMSEMDKLKRQVTEYEAKIAQADRQNLQRKIAAEVGLPDVLALRIQGDDEEAMMEDAKALAATLPKKPSSPTLSATNPGNGQSPSETLAQQRQRVYGGGTDIFSPGEAAKLGGGVVFKDNAQ
jgi:hypothetical protein